MTKSRLLLLLPLALSCHAGAPRTSAEPGAPAHELRQAPQEEQQVRRVLDDWHQAASAADGVRYFGHLAADAVFLGTDATERWSLAEFQAFCEPYFARGQGWTYVPRERHVALQGELAWVDEQLWNEKYGLCRGTGVLRRESGAWRIAHYSLTLLVPNELAGEVVRLIAAGEPPRPSGAPR